MMGKTVLSRTHYDDALRALGQVLKDLLVYLIVGLLDVNLCFDQLIFLAADPQSALAHLGAGVLVLEVGLGQQQSGLALAHSVLATEVESERLSTWHAGGQASTNQPTNQPTNHPNPTQPNPTQSNPTQPNRMGKRTISCAQGICDEHGSSLLAHQLLLWGGLC